MRTLVALWLVAVSAPATAQVFDMGSLTATLSIDAVTQSERARAASRIALQPARAPRHFAGPARSRPVALTYIETPALQQHAVDQYIERISRKTPDVARTIADQLAKHGYAKIWADQMRGSGLRSNDAVDAVVAYTLLGWQIANGSSAEISNARMQSVRTQIAPALGANPALAGPQTRAALGEEMKLLFVTLQAGAQSAQREGNARRFSDGVAALFQRQAGYDLRAVRVTDRGFDR